MDVGTGQVTVKKFVTAVDCGVAVNPLAASGQVEGAVLMGLGYALTEEMVVDAAGKVVNPLFGPYWVMRSDDAPASEVFLVQTYEPSGPFGASAIGEIGIVGVAPGGAERHPRRDWGSPCTRRRSLPNAALEGAPTSARRYLAAVPRAAFAGSVRRPTRPGECAVHEGPPG